MSGFVFINPGTLLISVQQYDAGGASIARNKSLQRMFFLMGAGEQAGSGSAKIAQGWGSQKWERPRIEEVDPDRVTVSLQMHSILPEAKEGLRRHFGEVADRITGDDLTVLSIALLEGRVSNERLRNAVYQHPVEISAMLKRLVQEDFLEASGHGRGSVYRLRGDDGRSGGAINEMERDYGYGHLFSGNGDNPIGNSGTSDENSGTPRQNHGTSGENSGSSGHSDSGPANRLSTRERVTAFLKGDCRTVSEIAAAVGVSASYVSNTLLPEMVKNGLVERRYPAKNHPKQAYRVGKDWMVASM